MRFVLGLLLAAGCAGAGAAEPPADSPDVVLTEPTSEPARQSSWQRLPQGVRGDQDRDEVPDARDRCPTIAEDQDGIDDADGCPDRDVVESDQDGDGVPNVVDKCPLDPEDRDGIDDTDGCPEAR